MSRVSTYGTGNVAASEGDLIITARAASTTGKRGIVWCHEHGAFAHYLLGYTQFGTVTLAESGHPTISTDLGGTTHWGNDTSQTRIQQAWDYLVAQKGVASDKVILMAYSMGNLAALNWARANPSKVAAMACVLPANNLADFHDNNRGGYATEIETAYGGAAAYAAAVASHNPADHAAEYAGIPIKMWYSTDDPLVIPSTVTAFAAASGALTQSLGAVAHTSSSLDPAQVTAFLAGYF